MNKNISLLIILFASITFGQYGRDNVYHPFTGTLVLSFEGGLTHGLTDYKDFTYDYIGKGSLEYFFPTYSKSTFGLKAFGGTGFLKGKDALLTPKEFRTTLNFAGGGIVYNLSIAEAIFPYLSVGASYLWFNPLGNDGNPLPNNQAGVYKTNELNYNAEFGIRIYLTRNLTLNINSAVHISPNDRLDDLFNGNSNDIFAVGAIGLSFAFFGDYDSDDDGVPDSKDLCDNTPFRVKVDRNGCPLDSDKDGIFDYKDNCDDTPEGVKVDRNGCPLDSDKDNVPDYLDICPNTPRNVAVDEFGCPKDSDDDGIADYVDKCPKTPIGVVVDQHGCPLDSDNDGVADHIDKCPNTHAGTQVDETGCPITVKEKEPIIKEVPVVKEVVLSAGASFDVGKSKLLPAAEGELLKLFEAMKSEKDSRWLIEGHTDNSGSYQLNKKLSLERAQSVLNYFVSRRISANRFEVRGMGPDFPIAPNTTPEGKAKNRRVVILRIN